MAMDREAAARIMSSEYKKNDGKATDWSRRAQSAADRNDPQSGIASIIKSLNVRTIYTLSTVTPMDQEAAARIVSSEYRKNNGKATEWSMRAQSAADRNESASELKNCTLAII